MFCQATRTARRFVPTLDTLEDRLVPATASSKDGVLRIDGNAKDEQIALIDNGDGDVSVQQPGVSNFIGIDIQSIVINTLGGKDQVRYIQQASRTRPLSMRVNLGTGNDRFSADLRGGVLNFRTMQVSVVGSTGRDTIEVVAGNAFIEEGFNVQGLALLQLDLNGGSDNDTIRVAYNGKADGELRVNARGGADDDTIDCQLTIRPDSEGRLGAGGQQATVEGNSGNDTLTFRVRNQTSPGFEVFAKIDGGSNGFFLFSRRDQGRRTANVASAGLESDIIVL